MNIELHEPRDNAKRIVPLTTSSGLKIGLRYVPPKTATYASPGSYYRPQESRWWPWLILAIGVAGFVLSFFQEVVRG